MRVTMDQEIDQSNRLSQVGDELSCAEFQEQMPQLLERDIHDHTHLRSCERCSALLQELEAIASWARDLFKTDIEPPDELWNKIEKQMAEPEPTGYPIATKDSVNDTPSSHRMP